MEQGLVQVMRRGNNNSSDSYMHQGDEGMAKGVDTIAPHTLTKKGYRRQCQAYRIISLIVHLRKVML